ncbi:MAG: ATP-dependent endonuclease [Marinilabiliales bacterium]|nr:MAG: ATP-dependent endonuclease [Marinilabiliales bacterium]
MDIKQYDNLQETIRNNLGFPPTSGQESLISKLASLVLSNHRGLVFVLAGYAGTGKTTMVSALVKSLPAIRQRAVLLAPTGRAAKVLATYSQQKAYTIHKYIYFAHSTPDGRITLNLAENKHRNTLFIVDEASMIPDHTPGPDGSSFSSRNILDDLMEYVFSGQNCKLLLLGDNAQLPPVGLSISPALNLENLKSRYPYHFGYHELTEVVRQESESGILSHATFLRQKLAAEDYGLPLFKEHQYTDFIRINGHELQDALEDSYSTYNQDNSVIITRSNKRANLFNQAIRERILFREGEINAGDFLMVVRNNYYWLPEGSNAGFIANGDIVEVLRVKNIDEVFGFRFAEIDIRFPDYPDEEELEVKVLLDTLTSESANLPREEMEKLWYTIMEDYADIPNKKQKAELVKNSSWFNALQVKFAYSLTCHKTQGGQWDTVFIDQGYLKDNPDREWFRWLYTAITRGVNKVYMVNFREDFWD